MVALPVEVKWSALPVTSPKLSIRESFVTAMCDFWVSPPTNVDNEFCLCLRGLFGVSLLWQDRRCRFGNLSSRRCVISGCSPRPMWILCFAEGAAVCLRTCAHNLLSMLFCDTPISDCINIELPGAQLRPSPWQLLPSYAAPRSRSS